MTMTLVTDSHVPLTMNCNDFDDPLTFSVVPTSDQSFNLSKILFYDQIPAKLWQSYRCKLGHVN